MTPAPDVGALIARMNKARAQCAAAHDDEPSSDIDTALVAGRDALYEAAAALAAVQARIADCEANRDVWREAAGNEAVRANKAEARVAALERELIPPTPHSVVIERARDKIASLEAALRQAEADARRWRGVHELDGDQIDAFVAAHWINPESLNAMMDAAIDAAQGAKP